MDPRGKRVKVKKEPTPEKRASVGGINPAAAGDRLTSWRFAQVDLDGNWGWRGLDPGHVQKLHSHLAALESKTLATLIREKLAKDIPVAHICRPAQERLQEIDLDDTDTLWELRLPSSDSWRAWGIVDGPIFFFLWWDPEHTVCRHLPKRVRRR